MLLANSRNNVRRIFSDESLVSSRNANWKNEEVYDHVSSYASGSYNNVGRARKLDHDRGIFVA